jgi:hypothetical protein
MERGTVLKITLVAAVILIASFVVLSQLAHKQPPNLDFSSSKCLGQTEEDFELMWKTPSSVVKNSAWLDNETLEVRGRIILNCIEYIVSGNYRIEDDKLILGVVVDKPLWAKITMSSASCRCGHDVNYTIHEITQKDYEIEIMEIQ